LELSLAETPKNEDLLIAACHFWSNGVNAFLFGHDPMSPTLADVYMITGLDITGSVQPWDFRSSSRQTGVKPGSGKNPKAMDKGKQSQESSPPKKRTIGR
jgi:hypothetical protein